MRCPVDDSSTVPSGGALKLKRRKSKKGKLGK